MPASVIADPLSVRFVFANGTTWTEALHGLPNPTLAADLAAGLAMCVHPHGGIGSKDSAKAYGWALRRMVREMSANGFNGGASDLRRHHLTRHWLASTRQTERPERLVLRALEETGYALDPEVSRYLEGRSLNAKPSTEPLKSYTEGEWRRITEHAQRIVTEAAQAQAEARRTAVGADPREAGLGPGQITAGDIAHILLAAGPLSRRELCRHLGWGYTDSATKAALSSDPLGSVREALFPTREVVNAYKVLFATFTGIVPDGISSLGIEDIVWAGDSDILLSYIKGRTGPEGLHLPKRAVRLLERWLTYSAPLRSFTPEPLRSELWIYTYGPGWSRPPMVMKPDKYTGSLATWAERTGGISADDGSPLHLHKGRFRPTFESLLASRGWTGRTTIDPNHTAGVEGDHYLAATTPAQIDAVETLIEEGQSDLLRKALPPTVLTTEQTVELVEQFPDLIASLGLDDAAITELVGGERDVFTAACADQLSGQHGPAGQPCPARPWVCLMCPLAVFLPRNASNLLRLQAFFRRQFRQMPSNQFMRVFGPYADRLDTEILPRFDERTLQEAAAEVTDDDQEIPLRPEETTL